MAALVNEPGYYALLHANGMGWANVLATFAHDLAEAQRLYCQVHDIPLHGSAYTDVGDVINLIDPDVG